MLNIAWLNRQRSFWAFSFCRHSTTKWKIVQKKKRIKLSILCSHEIAWVPLCSCHSIAQIETRTRGWRSEKWDWSVTAGDDNREIWKENALFKGMIMRLSNCECRGNGAKCLQTQTNSVLIWKYKFVCAQPLCACVGANASHDTSEQIVPFVFNKKAAASV